MRSVWPWITFETIYLFSILAIATVVVGGWGVLPLSYWLYGVAASMFFGLFMMIVSRPQLVNNRRQYVLLHLIALPVVFFVSYWVAALKGNYSPILWLPLLAIIAGVFHFAIMRPLGPHINRTIGRIPEGKKFWRLSARTLFILVYFSVVYMTFRLVTWWMSSSNHV